MNKKSQEGLTEKRERKHIIGISTWLEPGVPGEGMVENDVERWYQWPYILWQ